MARRVHQAAGLEYLELITELLRRARTDNATSVSCEAADLQWWWRRDQHPDPALQTFWLDDDGTPVAAVVFTDWNGRWGCLAECSLYRPDLDLAVYAPNGDVAAYGLFWPDPVTGVGLVEPMRTEDAYQGLGLARHVLTSGLAGLAGHRCSTLKVCYIEGNEAARRLYLGAGFEPGASSRTYRLAR